MRVAKGWALPVAVLLVGALAWWDTHPQAFASVGDEVVVTAAVDETVTVGMSAWPAAGRVVVRGVSARVEPHSARADIRVLLCRPRSGANVGAFRGPATQACRAVVPPAGSALRPVRRDGEDLVLQVTPHQPGAVRVEGVRLRYRDGIRFGWQNVGVATVINVK